MIVSFRTMRTKDEEKRAALFEATVKLVNNIGFVSSSVSRIAKEAGVSPATIYIYYKNKDDLLVSSYVDIKKSISKALLKDFDPELPIRDTLRKVCLRLFDYASKNIGYFMYAEQFSKSSYVSQLDKAEVEKYFDPIAKVLQKGIEQKIIKDVNKEMLIAFIFHPIMALANPRLCREFEPDRKNIETAFTMIWDAIKL